MAARVSETFVLRTFPFREGDLIVSFFTRDLGKLRGVARRARRPKSPFGSGLERLSQVRMAFFQKESAELVNLTSCELIQSQFGLGDEYAASVALDYITEMTEHLLPPNEPNEKFFRLLTAVLSYLRSGGNIWAALTYFSVWAVRLSGIWPEGRVCDESVEIAHEMFSMPVGEIPAREWSKATAQDLRRMLVRAVEQHVERRMLTVPILEGL
ncbi:MAG: DNA repair protein RecO [Bryobacteraceae bacterium]